MEHLIQVYFKEFQFLKFEYICIFFTMYFF